MNICAPGDRFLLLFSARHCSLDDAEVLEMVCSGGPFAFELLLLLLLLPIPSPAVPHGCGAVRTFLPAGAPVAGRRLYMGSVRGLDKPFSLLSMRFCSIL